MQVRYRWPHSSSLPLLTVQRLPRENDRALQCSSAPVIGRRHDESAPPARTNRGDVPLRCQFGGGFLDGVDGIDNGFLGRHGPCPNIGGVVSASARNKAAPLCKATPNSAAWSAIRDRVSM